MTAGTAPDGACSRFLFKGGIGMARITGAKVVVTWHNKMVTELSTNPWGDAEPPKKVWKQRVGWKLVRFGLGLIFPRAQWMEITRWPKNGTSKSEM